MPFLTYFLYLLIVLPDGGPIYAETNLQHMFVEPWNAISSLSFFIPVFYWAGTLIKKYRSYPFLSFCIPLMALGGLGSTLYHAFRNSYFLLLLDVMPILLLTLAVSLYFWAKIFKKKIFLIPLIFAFLFLRWIALSYFSPPFSINLAYFFRGMMIFLPALLLLIKIHFFRVHLLIFALSFFGLALLFRSYDHYFSLWMPMGSHWLWHLNTSVASLYLAQFLYDLRNLELKKF